MAQETSMYQALNEIFASVSDSIVQNVYSGSKDVFGSGFFNAFILLSALFWLVLKIIKTEQFSIKDVYPITFFLIYYYIVYFITQDETIYYETLDLLQYPRNTLTYIFSKSIGANHPADIVNSLYVGLKSTQEVLDRADGAWYSFNLISKTLSVIFFLLSIALLAVLAFTIIFSSLLARIIISFGAFMFICLLWNKTRGYFFSWLKLYLSFSFYAPLGALFGSVALAFGNYASNVAVKMGEVGSMDIFGMVVVIIGMVLCIFLFTKIPLIVNAIVGSANDSSTGGSGLVGFMAGAVGGGLSSLKNKMLGKANSFGSSVIDKIKGKLGGNKDKEGEQNATDEDTTHQ